MPLQPPNLPSISRLVLHYTHAPSGATAVNVLYVQSEGAAALDVFNRFTIAWTPELLAYVAVGTRLHTVGITRLDNQTASQEFSTTGVEWDGTAAGQAGIQVCELIKYSTGFRGLGSRGLTYLPFISEEAMENGRLLVAGLPGQVTAWEAFVNTLTTQAIPLQVVSMGRADHETLPDAPAINHTVTAVAVDPILATQRNRQSRLRG
jgi:hypothetical protein